MIILFGALVSSRTKVRLANLSLTRNTILHQLFCILLLQTRLAPRAAFPALVLFVDPFPPIALSPSAPLSFLKTKAQKVLPKDSEINVVSPHPQVLDALLKQGSVPFPKTFGKIIFCLLDEGRLPEAEAVLASFYQHVESQPDPQLYTTVFDAFVRRYLRVKQPERVLPLVKQARSYKQLIPLKSLYDWAQHLERHSREHAASFRKYIEDETSRAR